MRFELKDYVKVIDVRCPSPDEIFIRLQHNLDGLPQGTKLVDDTSQLIIEHSCWEVIFRLMGTADIGYVTTFENEEVYSLRGTISNGKLMKCAQLEAKGWDEKRIYKYILKRKDTIEIPRKGSVLKVIKPNFS